MTDEHQSLLNSWLLDLCTKIPMDLTYCWIRSDVLRDLFNTNYDTNITTRIFNKVICRLFEKSNHQAYDIKSNLEKDSNKRKRCLYYIFGAINDNDFKLKLNFYNRMINDIESIGYTRRLMIHSANRTRNVLNEANDEKKPISIHDVELILINSLQQKDSNQELNQPSNSPSLAQNVTTTQDSQFYPTLLSYNILPNFDTEENENKIKTIIKELVTLHRRNHRSLTFNYHGNEVKGRLLAVPRSMNYDSFRKVCKTTNWLDTLLSYIVFKKMKI